MKNKWYAFSKDKGYRQKRPPERKLVVVLLASTEEGVLPPGLAIGYRKDAAGEADSPFFVIPGIGGEVLAWCDCLPDDFSEPFLIWPLVKTEPALISLTQARALAKLAIAASVGIAASLLNEEMDGRAE